MADGDPHDARRKVREKLAFVFRNKMMAENLALNGLPIDQDGGCRASRYHGRLRARAQRGRGSLHHHGGIKRLVDAACANTEAGLDELVVTFVGTT